MIALSRHGVHGGRFILVPPCNNLFNINGYYGHPVLSLYVIVFFYIYIGTPFQQVNNTS